MKVIHFSTITKEFINLTTSGINDSKGNNNNSADFGESLFLKLTISNLGLTDATDLYAKISSTSEWATITNDSVFLGSLPARSEISFNDKLSLAISNNVPDLGLVNVNLILKDKSE